MARIIGGSIIGEIRGKLGGNVFSRNKAGQYIRSYAVPTNPNTVAQDRARARFGGASGTYHSMSAAQKAAWGVFAESTFSPKVGVNEGQFSGFNAYTSLFSAVGNGNDFTHDYDAKVNGSAVATPATFTNFSGSTTPPVYMLQPAVKEQGTGNALTLSLSSASVDAAGVFDFTINVNGAPSGGADIEDFVDPNDEPFGFLIQMSNALPQKGMFFANENRYALGYTGLPSLDSADRSGVETLYFSSNAEVSPGDYQSFPVAGQAVKLSCYMVSEGGMQVCIGSYIDIVGAPA